MKFKLILSILLLKIVCLAQNKDSLLNALKTAAHDTTKCTILYLLIATEHDNTIWPKYNEQLLTIAKKNFSQKGEEKRYFSMVYGSALNNKGYIEMVNGNRSKAYQYYFEALEIDQQNKNEDGIANAMQNIAYLYGQDGNVPKAIEFYHNALRIKLKLKEFFVAATVYNNLAYIFSKQGEYERSTDYYERALELQEKLNDKDGIANTCSNLSHNYTHAIYDACKDRACKLSQLKKGIQYLKRSIVLFKEVGDEIGQANSENLLAGLYEKRGDPYCTGDSVDCKIKADKQTFELYQSALRLRLNQNYRKGIAQSYSSLAAYYLNRQNYNEAQNFAEKSLLLSREENNPDLTADVAEVLQKIYEKKGDYKRSLEMHKLFTRMRDSVLNDVTKKTALQKSFQLEYEKKTLADSLRAEQVRKVTQAQLKQEKTQRIALYGGLILVALFGAFMFQRFRVSQKQNVLIRNQKSELAKQKDLVDEKQKEILDSIHYAKRIQQALLAHENFVKEHLSEHFIFFQPKDIVSGDFYWAAQHNNTFYLAICDSTGHGVPGAFMCLLNIGFLSEAIKEKNIYEPHEVFNYVRKRLETSISGEGQKDGFDGILIAWDKGSDMIRYAAANNAPILIRENTILELSKDKMPVGKGERQQSFSLFTQEIKQGDLLYLYTDGYADQFGGPKGKKFKYKTLDDLLLSVSGNSMQEQLHSLQRTLKDWKGELEQVDDVLVAGIRF